MRKSIIGVMSTVVGAGIGAIAVKKAMKNKITEVEKLSDKHLALFQMMNQWVKLKQDGKSLVEYFKKNNYKNIAIYGMSYAGETLVEELKLSDIKVKYGIDKKADRIYSEINIITLDNELEEVDAVVVTAITFYDEIVEILEKKLACPILSLEDILYEI